MNMLSRSLFVLVSGIMVYTLFTPQAFAVPAFARQVGVDCGTCHFQHFPKLNAFGRAFKANGYSQISQAPLEGDKLSIAPVLNASFFIKTRITDTDKESPKLEFPDEAALLLGGRLGEGMGGIVEFSDSILSYKVSLTHQLNNGIALGMTPFATDSLGPAYGFELMNTGAVRNIRPFERSSRPTIGAGGLDLSGAVTGVAIHAFHEKGFAHITYFAPDSKVAGGTKLDTGTDLSMYFRAAWTPRIGEFDTGLGFGMMRGQTKATPANGTTRQTYGTHATFLDGQFQGMVNGKELGVYLMYGIGSNDPTDIYNAGSAKAPTGVGLDVEYTLTDHFGLIAALGRHNNGSTLSPMVSTGIGGYLKLGQNITLQPMYEAFSGDQAVLKRRVTLLLETAF